MLEYKCRQAIERFQMLSEGESITVGLSGGADSCALLHFLCQLRDEWNLHITAVHVNHMIRGAEAERDAAFAERFCRELNVPFHLYRRDIPHIAAEKGVGLEQCGREERYSIFAQEATKNSGKIATAHTLSDSVETVLFHIIRGCSVSGLTGIPPVRGNIIRPLILCERAEIEAYCEQQGIHYMTDSTNLSNDYTRNKIRLQLLPLMREINPSVDEAIGRLSEMARLDDVFLCSMADTAAEEFLKNGCADRLFLSEVPVRNRALMKICAEKLHIKPEQQHILTMADALSRGAGSINLPGGWIFSVKNGMAAFGKKTDDSRLTETFEKWHAAFVPGEIITPFSQKIISILFDKTSYNSFVYESEKKEKKFFKNCLDYDKISKAAFRFRREGDRFSPAGRNCTKSLKKLFNEEKIPPDMRCRIPLLECEGQIAWIGGIGAAEPFKVTKATQRILLLETE